MKLNVGCGKHRLEGWQHVDRINYGDNIVFDLDFLSGTSRQMCFPDDTFDEFKISHILEHLHDTLGCMEELWRIAKPGAIATVAVPFAFSEAAIEDQTHVRHFTFNSFCFFSQPVYCNADYGYRGDWQPEKVTVVCGREHARTPRERLIEMCKRERNVGLELVATLRAVKPRRAQDVRLVQVPTIDIAFTP